MLDTKEWQKSDLQVFWKEIAPCNHLLQIYENDLVFLESLEGFALGSILARKSVIIIATDEHLNALEERLVSQGFNIDSLIADHLYIPLNAEETLSKFMVNDWPDERLFTHAVSEIIYHAYDNGHQLNVFGEMVALLWAKGLNGATVQLEHLWNKFCNQMGCCLFCAYPKSGFPEDVNTSMDQICKTHSRIIAGWSKPSTEIFYKNTA